MKVGFIGGGNMASAMIGGMIQKGVVSAGKRSRREAFWFCVVIPSSR